MLVEKDWTRLVNILGQTGADQDGIVLNAASAANKMLRDQGLTWAEVLSHRKLPSRIVEELAETRAENERLKRELEGKVPKPVMKDPRRKRICAWCREKFTPKSSGRVPLYCSNSCRQSAHQKRKWDSQARFAEEIAKQQKEAQLKSDLTPRLRLELIAELVQSGVIHITSPDHIDLFVAGRNEYRGNKAIGELEVYYRDTGYDVGLAAIARWKQARKPR
jgi:hypothetical protein